MAGAPVAAAVKEEHDGSEGRSRAAALRVGPAPFVREHCVGQHAFVPDDLDYARLGWLIAHPDERTPDDPAWAEALVAEQKRAVEESHP